MSWTTSEDSDRRGSRSSGGQGNTSKHDLMPSVFRMRTASIQAATPAALSVAPVPPCQESRCAPSITTSPLGSVPGSSAMVFTTGASLCCSTLS